MQPEAGRAHDDALGVPAEEEPPRLQGGVPPSGNPTGEGLAVEHGQVAAVSTYG